jgi:histone acetyltransferase MYST1
MIESEVNKVEQVATKLSIGDKYPVVARNGQIFDAEIIDKRRVKSLKTEEGPAISTTFEYYVHYIDLDRRLDEWVTIDRINTEIETVGSSLVRTLSKSTNLRNRKHEYLNVDTKKTDRDVQLASLEKEHEEMTKVKNVSTIILGKYEIDAWYFSPYPASFCEFGSLYICEYCLRYMKKKETLDRHKLDCTMKSPPGKLIYQEHDITMFEIDGKDEKLYCQNLCLLSKLFLDHKTLYYDVEPFLFYTLCETDAMGYHHIVGYFSKEKQSQENYNLACILTFPPYQRKGYGKFLISVSFELTKRENTTGSPEKPLSDLGKISYRSYWTYIILKLLEQYSNEGFTKNITLQDMSTMTGIKVDDILSTLLSLNMIKHWKGQYAIKFSPKVVETHLSNTKPMRLCKPECLTWEKPKK